MKTLVLAEKPSVGKDIARVLGCRQGGAGYIEGGNYIVTWALGHLVTLADPEIYNKKYEQWDINDLPIIPPKLDLVVIKQTGKQFNVVKGQLIRSDVSQIVIATDAGREGELVARWILLKTGVKKPVKRLWISSVTDKAIKEGFAKLKDGKEFENLYTSAVARAEADWIVGINGTRALTTKYNAQLSCGRVQTPTLAIINSREKEIRGFRPQKFYGITVATDTGLKLTWQDKNNGDIRIFDKEKRDSIYDLLKGKDGQIIEIEKSLKKTNAPNLYDLTELQRDANKAFNFSAKDTLSIMQQLYESHKLLTYPRTDSRYISSDIVETLAERVKACAVGNYKKFAAVVLKSPIPKKLHIVDNSKVTDHHAIIPTEQYADLTDLNERERKIYDLVVKRFLASLYPPFEYEETKIKVKIGNEIFTARGKVVLKSGWKEVYNNQFTEDSTETVKEQILPKLSKNETLKITSLTPTAGETKPPALLNEATLLSAMENPVKYMDKDNKELVKTIGETGGLGTVATRADIIEKLFSSAVIEKKGNDIITTGKGRQLLKLAPKELKSPELTAQWEQKLNKISKGNLNKSIFMNEIVNYTKTIILEIKSSQEKFKHDNLTSNKCPECGKFLLNIKGKKGTMLVCENRECGYRKNVTLTTNARCPNCHKKLELIGEGESKRFMCACGFKERLSVFEERRKNSSGSMSKKELDNFLKKQQSHGKEVVNDALSSALKGIKFD